MSWTQSSIAVAVVLAAAVTIAAQQAQTPAPAQGTTAPKTNLGNDPNGNPVRLAVKTGHVSNYDEKKVAPYTLPDPLVMADGTPVRDAGAWRSRRRAEILRRYETEIYGRIPRNAPKVAWRVGETDPRARDGAAVMKRLIGTIGEREGAPEIKLTIHRPRTRRNRCRSSCS